MYRLALVAGLAAASTPALVQAQGVRGVVVDSVGRGLPEAEIIVGTAETRTRSDSLGAFRLAERRAGALQPDRLLAARSAGSSTRTLARDHPA
ncbi:MAG: hypothetical protein IT357_05980 [Gemmatimonadaceae bacterium]|nr:hypothetical protein [Gemmatimonadaceae bacterium]